MRGYLNVVNRYPHTQAPPPKNGEGAWKIWSRAPWRSVRGFVRAFDNQIIAHAVWLEILPIHLYVAGDIQVGFLWTILYIGYNVYSFYRDIRSGSVYISAKPKSNMLNMNYGIRVARVQISKSQSNFQSQKFWILDNIERISKITDLLPNFVNNSSKTSDLSCQSTHRVVNSINSYTAFNLFSTWFTWQLSLLFRPTSMYKMQFNFCSHIQVRPCSQFLRATYSQPPTRLQHGFSYCYPCDSPE